VASVVGGVLAMIHWGLRRSRIAAVLAVEHAGADISLIDTFGLGAPKQAAPDDEATYATFEGEPLRLRIYRQGGPGSRAPVLVYVHGWWSASTTRCPPPTVICGM
jgi:acetyl esterase/lipase